ncbi:condensation domain-containing protein [Streptomyces bacillaris]|uniref:hypothetical protein n=1 Tax=Streptomyces bacillaris TaxID=68179 RepID=UPI003820D79A
MSGSTGARPGGVVGREGRMSVVDRAFMLFSQGTSRPLLVGHVLDFPVGSFSLEDVRARVAERAVCLETLRTVAVPGARSWVRTAPPDVALHVDEVRVDGPLREETDEVLCRPLPGGGDLVPRWDLRVLTCPAEGVQRVCFRIDHAVVDGVGTAHLVAALLADEPVRGPHAYRPPGAGRGSTAWLRTVPYRRFAPDETVPYECGAAPSGRESLAYADVPDASLRALASRWGATVNEICLTALTGALAEGQQRHGGRVRDLWVMMPMSVREAGAELTPGNAALSAVVRLPCSLPTPADRLRSLAAQSRRHKESGLRDSGWRSVLRIPPRLLQRVMLRPGLRLAVSHIAINDTYRVLGAPLTAATVVALNAPGLLGYVSLTRTTETARIGVLHDRAHPAAAGLPGACVRSLEELERLADPAVSG